MKLSPVHSELQRIQTSLCKWLYVRWICDTNSKINPLFIQRKENGLDNFSHFSSLASLLLFDFNHEIHFYINTWSQMRKLRDLKIHVFWKVADFRQLIGWGIWLISYSWLHCFQWKPVTCSFSSHHRRCSHSNLLFGLFSLFYESDGFLNSGLYDFCSSGQVSPLLECAIHKLW